MSDRLTTEQQAQIDRLTDRQRQTLTWTIADIASALRWRPFFKSLSVRRVRKQAEAGSIGARLVLLALEENYDEDGNWIGKRP